MPKIFPELNKNTPSSPEYDSFRTIVTTAIIESVPKQIQSKGNTVDKTISKTLNERKRPKTITDVYYDTIDVVNSPETKQRHNKVRQISLPRSITQPKKNIDCNVTKNDQVIFATTELTTKTTNTILEESQTSSTMNQFSEQENVLKCKETVKVSKGSNVNQKENYNSKIAQHDEKLTETKAMKIANRAKLKRSRKADVSQDINADINYVTSPSDENMSSSLRPSNSLIQNQNISRYDQLMSSFIEKISKNYTDVSEKCQKSDRDTTFTKSNNQIYNTITSMDIVMRDTADYESQYSDNGSPERAKRKNKIIKRTVNRFQSKTLKPVHADKNKLPQKKLKTVSAQYMKRSVKRSTTSSSPSLPSLYSEKEAPKAKILETTLTDTDSNNEVQSNVSTEVISPSNKFLNESSVIVPPLHPEPHINLHKTITNADDILENIGNDFQQKIMKTTSLCHIQNLSLVSKSPANENSTNAHINSWIATGLPVDAVQNFKSMAEVVLQSYTMIIRTHLQSLRAGPLHPDLAKIYETFTKLDNEMKNYFEEK